MGGDNFNYDLQLNYFLGDYFFFTAEVWRRHYEQLAADKKNIADAKLHFEFFG